MASLCTALPSYRLFCLTASYIASCSWTFAEQKNKYVSMGINGAGATHHAPLVVIGYGTAGAAVTHQLLRTTFPCNGAGYESKPSRYLGRMGNDGQLIIVIDPSATSKLALVAHHYSRDYGCSVAQLPLRALDGTVQDIDILARTIALQDNTLVTFDRCCITVGTSAHPSVKDFIGDIEGNQSHSHQNCHRNPMKAVADLNKAEDVQSLYRIVARGGHVTLVGANCWETLGLAGKLAAIATTARRGGGGAGGSGGLETDEESNTSHPVTLVFPAFGPMASSLPRYLSQALAQRLASRGVQLLPYSQVRYVQPISIAPTPETVSRSESTSYATGGDSIHEHHSSSGSSSRLMVYTATAYDTLATYSFATNGIAFAPTCVPSVADYALLRDRHSNGVYGDSSAESIATETETEASKGSKAAGTKTSDEDDWEHPSAFLLRSGLEIDRVNGGLVVNASMQACAGVYAAGDVASVYVNTMPRVAPSAVLGVMPSVSPSSSGRGGGSGGGDGGGGGGGLYRRGLYRGWDHAKRSGMVAGYNMAREAATHTTTTLSPTATSALPTLSMYSPHVPVYEASSPEMGIHLTFVGNCSAALESHGFWWRVHNNSKALLEKQRQDEAKDQDKDMRGRSNHNQQSVPAPPLGLGVVFYVHEEKIVGVLISGLPPSPSSAAGVVTLEQLDDMVIGEPCGTPAAGTSRRSGGGRGVAMSYSDLVYAHARELVGLSFNQLLRLAKDRRSVVASDPASEVAVGVDHTSNSIWEEANNDSSIIGGIGSNDSSDTSSGSSDSNRSGIGSSRGSTSGGRVRHELGRVAAVVLSPVLSAHLYPQLHPHQARMADSTHRSGVSNKPHATTVTPEMATVTPEMAEIAEVAEMVVPKVVDVNAAVDGYPRPSYRYGPSARTAIKELADQNANEGINRPALPRERVLQTENIMGSRADRLSAAYSMGIIKGWQQPGFPAGPGS